MYKDRCLGFLIGFDLVPSKIDDDSPDGKEKYALELEKINDGIKFEEIGFILRRTTEEDENLLKKHLSSDLIYGNFPIPRIGKFVIENIGEDIYTSYGCYSIILGLRFLKKGHVYLSHEVYYNICVHEYLPPIIERPYILYYDEVEYLKKIVIFIDKSRKEDYKLRTVYNWFDKSYQEYHGRIDYNSLIDFMICSEALFTDEKNYRYVGSVIGLACSMLIGKDNNEREKIKSDFEDAYAIRNKEVHGGDLNKLNKRAKKRLKNIELLNEEIAEYLRRSIKKLLV